MPAMTTVKGILGVVLVLIGLVWIGQGLNLIKGSFMTAQPLYAVLGLVVAAIGLWLARTALREGGRAGGQPR